MYAFELAERLGMTVRDLRARMPLAEFVQWRARDSYAAKTEAFRDRVDAARGKMRGRRRGMGR